MAATNLLERAQSWSSRAYSTLVDLDDDILEAWDVDNIIVRTACKELLSRGDDLPLLCQAQYHLLLSAVDIYPGARMRRLYQAQRALRSSKIQKQSAKIWNMKDNNHIDLLQQAVGELITADLQAVAERKAAGKRRLAVSSRVKRSVHLELAYAAYTESQKEADQGKRQSRLGDAWAHMEKHEEGVVGDDIEDDAALHTLRALIDAAVNCLAVEDSDAEEAPSIPTTRTSSSRRSRSSHRSSRSISFLANPVSETRLYDAVPISELDQDISQIGREDEDDETIDEHNHGPWDHRPSMKERSPFRSRSSLEETPVLIEDLSATSPYLGTSPTAQGLLAPLPDHAPTRPYDPAAPSSSSSIEDRSLTRHRLSKRMRSILHRHAASGTTRSDATNKLGRREKTSKSSLSGKTAGQASVPSDLASYSWLYFSRSVASDNITSAFCGANRGFGITL